MFDRSAVDVGMIRLNMERAQAKLIRLAFIDYNHKVDMNTFCHRERGTNVE